MHHDHPFAVFHDDVDVVLDDDTPEFEKVREFGDLLAGAALVGAEPPAAPQGAGQALAVLVGRTQKQVLADGHPRQLPGDLEGPDQSTLGDTGRPVVRDVSPVESDRSGVGLYRTGHAVSLRM